MSARPTSFKPQAGFTLVELLVAMSAGLVVIFAATALITAGLHDTAQVAGRVQAVQEGRTGLEELVQELNSGCLVSDISPVQAATATGITPVVDSDASHLVFVSGVGDSADPTPTEHVVSIDAAGALVDTSYAYKGSPSALDTPSAWQFTSTPEGIATLMEQAKPNGSKLFQYTSYSNPANPTANSLLDAKDLSTPLSTDSAQTNAAANVAQVDIDIIAEPFDTQETIAGSADLDDSATFRLTSAGSSGTNFPCD